MIIRFPYHPHYGLDDDTRRRALALADREGIEAAAKAYRVHPSTIWKWRRDSYPTDERKD